MILDRKTLSRSLTLAHLSLAVLVALTLAGCGDEGFSTAPVSGTVTLDGNPVADIQVLFQPINLRQGEPGPGSRGITDAQGHFTLEMVDGSREGAVPGTHRVTLMYVDPNAAPEEEVGSPDGPEAEAAVPQFKLPPEARDGSLEFPVPEGGTDEANFEFTSPGS